MDYDIGRLTNWFANRRQRFRIKERKEQGPGDIKDSRKSSSSQSCLSLFSDSDTKNHFGSGFPSLTPAAIQHLNILANNQLHPSPELLKTWTTLLASSGAVEQDVINWIQHRNQEQSSQHTSTPSDINTATSMTPESSAISPISPQSQMKSTSPPFRQETTASPVALQFAHPNEHHDAQAAPSEPTSPTSPISNNEFLNQCIIHGVRDALASSQSTPSMPPKTAAEFEAFFSPFEQQISLLLHTLESTSRIGAPIYQ